MKDNIVYIVLLVLAAVLFANGIYHLVQYHKGKAKFEAEQECNAKIHRIVVQSRKLNDDCIEALEAIKGTN